MKQSEAYKLVDTLKNYCSEAYVASGEKGYYIVRCDGINGRQVLKFFHSIDPSKYYCSTDIVENNNRKKINAIIYSL